MPPANFIEIESDPKKDPLWGDRHPSGTPVLRVHPGFHVHGSRDWNADRGDDCEDPSFIFCPGQADQGDLPRVGIVTEGRPEGSSIERDRVPLRAGGATISEDRALEREAPSIAVGERSEGGA